MPTNKFVMDDVYDNVCYLMTYRLTGQETGDPGTIIMIGEKNEMGNGIHNKKMSATN